MLHVGLLQPALLHGETRPYLLANCISHGSPDILSDEGHDDESLSMLPRLKEFTFLELLPTQLILTGLKR